MSPKQLAMMRFVQANPGTTHLQAWLELNYWHGVNPFRLVRRGLLACIPKNDGSGLSMWFVLPAGTEYLRKEAGK